MTAISERQRAHLYIQKAKKSETFYIQKARHFAKSNTISVTFLYTKSKTLYVTLFVMKFLKVALLYKNHDTLHYVAFLYSKSWHFAKSKTICVTFLFAQKKTNPVYVRIKKEPKYCELSWAIKMEFCIIEKKQ